MSRELFDEYHKRAKDALLSAPDYGDKQILVSIAFSLLALVEDAEPLLPIGQKEEAAEPSEEAEKLKKLKTSIGMFPSKKKLAVKTTAAVKK